MLELPGGVTLYFARHGETEANIEKRFSGYKDTPLTAKGRPTGPRRGRNSRARSGAGPGAGFRLQPPRPRPTDHAHRARDRWASAPDGYRVDERLKEINLGLWDQLTDDEARALDADLFDRRNADKWHVRVPQGENYAEVAARAENWIADVKTDTFAVSHGAFTRILRGLFAGLDGQGMSALDEPQGVVFRARRRELMRLDP